MRPHRRNGIVGYSRIANSDQHAFLHTHGVMHDLNDATLINGAGWILRDALVINDSGQILGTGLNPTTGLLETVILTPVPVVLSQLVVSPNAVVGGYSTTGIVTISR